MNDSTISLTENLICLLCCVEEIDQRVETCLPHEKWRWVSRRNTAMFLLNRLGDSAAEQQLTPALHEIPQIDRKRIADSQSLLAPIDTDLPQQWKPSYLPDPKLVQLIRRLHHTDEAQRQ